MRVKDIAKEGLFSDGDWVESKDQDPSGEIRLIQLADIGDGNFIDKSSRYMNRETAERLNCTFLKKGDVLIARMPDPIGRACIFPLEGNEKYVTVVDVGILRLTKEYDSKYVMYGINSPLFRRQVESQVTGTTRQRITRKKIGEIEIPIPPLPAQKKIAAILDAADAYRQKTKTLIAKYDELTQSLFLDMFFGVQGEKVSMSSICEVNPKKSQINSLDRSTMVSFVPMANVSEEGEINLEEERTLESVWSGFTFFQENDVVFAKITPCMENGKGAIMRGLKNGIGFGTTEFHVLRPISECTTSEYIFYLTHSPHFRDLAELNMTGSAGQKRVPKDFFEKYKVVLPPIELQNQFAERIQKIEAQKAQAQQSLEKAEELFNSLLQRAFKGELVKE